MSEWLKKGTAFAGAYLKGQVVAIEGGTKKDCPYNRVVPLWPQARKYTEAWMAGFGSIVKARGIPA